MTLAAILNWAIVSILLASHLTTAVLTFTGQTLLLDGIPYYVPPTPYTQVSLPTTLKSATSANGLVPVTVVGVSTTNSSLGAIEGIIDGFASDDVWNPGFLEGELTK